MNPAPDLLDPPGNVVALGALHAAKAQQFADYLNQVGPEAFAELLEVRQQPDPAADIIVFRVDVERPQKLSYDIRRTETLAALFPHADDSSPEIYALRGNFPLAPHTNLRDAEFPRSLCLYDQAFVVVRLTWTPAAFLQRIRLWLSKTATGTLHLVDQPLEPLIPDSSYHLVVPSDFNALELHQTAKLLDIFRFEGSHNTLIARWHEPKRSDKAQSIAAAFVCPAQSHGVIRHCPSDLRQLDELCQKAGLALADALSSTLREWHKDKPAADVLKAQLILVLALPKTREAGGAIESVETRAFLTLMSVEEVGVALGVMAAKADVAGGAAGYIIGGPEPEARQLETVKLGLIQVQHALSAATAARMNGCPQDASPIVAVGMGALGSQVFNNLVRAGFGRWTIVDNDLLLPHNCARHLLPSGAVGHFKATAVAHLVEGLLDGEPIVTPIVANVLYPGKQGKALTDALGSAALVLDFSASVAVSRHLARSECAARHLSAFVTPKGDGLVITAEDPRRAVRLDWLEMLHYRAVLNEPLLLESLRSAESHLRYGNGCRDVTAQIAQDDIALWAGVASKEIKKLSKGSEAMVRVFQAAEDGSVSVFQLPIPETITLHLHDWTIRFDRWVLEKLGRLRQEKLPNETGGVLLGAFDTHARTCSIIDLLPSPPDSTEWPMTYIRGCSGLRQKVEEVQALLLGQVGYIGEWHSHPEGASTRPSEDDWKAYHWLVGHMHAEGLPAIMLIVGGDNQVCLVSDTPDEAG